MPPRGPGRSQARGVRRRGRRGADGRARQGPGVAGRPGWARPPGPGPARAQPCPARRTHPTPGRGRPALRLLPACGGGGGDCSGRGRDASCGRAHGRAGAGPAARLGKVPPGRSERGSRRADTSAQSPAWSRAARPPEVNPARSAAPRLRNSGRAAPAAEGAPEATGGDPDAGIVGEPRALRIDSSSWKAALSRRLPSPN